MSRRQGRGGNAAASGVPAAGSPGAAGLPVRGGNRPGSATSAAGTGVGTAHAPNGSPAGNKKMAAGRAAAAGNRPGSATSAAGTGAGTAHSPDGSAAGNKIMAARRAAAGNRPGGGVSSGAATIGLGMAGRTGASGHAGASGGAAAPADVRGAGSRHGARAVLLLLAAACGAALYSRQGAVEWLAFAVFAAIALWCLAIPYAAVGRIEGIRSTGTQTLTDGGELSVRLILQFSRPLPLMWVSVCEELVLAGDGAGGGTHSPLRWRSVGLPGFGRRLTVEYTAYGLHRGEWTFRPIVVAAGDLLGMTVRRFAVPVDTTILVRPAAPPGERIELTEKAAAGAGQGTRRPAAAAEPSIAAAGYRSRYGAGPETRAYRPGDPLRRVDWRAMARGMGAQTRINGDESPGEAVVLLDASAQAYGGDRRLFDAAAGRALQAVRGYAAAGSHVTLVCAGLSFFRLRVMAGDDASLRRLEARLSKLEADGEQPCADALVKTAISLPRGAAAVMVTTARGAEAAGALSMAAGLARTRGGKLQVILSSAGAAAEGWPAADELRCRTSLLAAGCPALLLPMPDAYRREPVIREGAGANAQAAN